MKNISEILENVKTVGIGGHIRPDGDCIGSCMALYLNIRKYFPDIEADVYLEDRKPVFDYIDRMDEVKTEAEEDKVYDLFITCDVSALDRLAVARKYFDAAKKTACIDHHASNDGYADYNYILPKASSASEVLYDLLDEDLIDKSIAEPMYMGIAHDSGVFRFQSTTPKTMRIAANMIEKGVNVNMILEETFFRKTYNQMMVTAKIQSEAVLALDGKCIYGYCTSEMMEEYGVTTKDLDAVVASIRNVDGVEVAMFLYQLSEDSYKVSLRSKNYVDVSKIAVENGGGGHVRAAGAEIHGELNDIINKLLNRIKQDI